MEELSFQLISSVSTVNLASTDCKQHNELSSKGESEDWSSQ